MHVVSEPAEDSFQMKINYVNKFAEYSYTLILFMNGESILIMQINYYHNVLISIVEDIR
jgi:hypothetical protein